MNIEALREATARMKFAAWLEKNGCAVLEPTSEWELVRYRGGNGTGVLYTNAKHQLTPNGPMRAILSFYLVGKEYAPGTKRKKRDKRQQMVERLILRDGHSKCFYCMQEMPENDRTLEHLVDLKYQGPDNIHNMVLAHSKCNNELSHLTPIEKIASTIGQFWRPNEHLPLDRTDPRARHRTDSLCAWCRRATQHS